MYVSDSVINNFLGIDKVIMELRSLLFVDLLCKTPFVINSELFELFPIFSSLSTFYHGGKKEKKYILWSLKSQNVETCEQITHIPTLLIYLEKP